MSRWRRNASSGGLIRFFWRSRAMSFTLLSDGVRRYPKRACSRGDCGLSAANLRPSRAKGPRPSLAGRPTHRRAGCGCRRNARDARPSWRKRASPRTGIPRRSGAAADSSCTKSRNARRSTDSAICTELTKTMERLVEGIGPGFDPCMKRGKSSWCKPTLRPIDWSAPSNSENAVRVAHLVPPLQTVVSQIA